MTKRKRVKGNALKRLRKALTEGTADSLSPGDRVGRYRIEKMIGQGGGGIIFLAHDPEVERAVALKVLRTENLTESGMKRFGMEAKSAAKLSHPNIVKIHEVGRSDGVDYIAMEYVDGENFGDVLRRGDNSVESTVDVVESIARAVHAAHEAGIIHRDLKPQNILIRKNGQAVLTDFGLAKPLDRSMTLTQTGAILGTPYFMSPEQIAGVKEVDFRTDIYSLGIILFEGVSGRLPFTGASPSEVFHKILEGASPSIREDVPDPLKRIIRHSMERERDDRYTTAMEMAEDLARWRRNEPVIAPSRGGVRPALRYMRRNKMLLAAAILGAVAAVAIGFNLGLDKEATQLEDQLQSERRLNDLLARCSEDGGSDPRDLIRELKEAQNRWVDNADIPTWKGRLLLRVGDVEGAESGFREALAVDDAHSEARFELARLMLKGVHFQRGNPWGQLVGGREYFFGLGPWDPELRRRRDEGLEHSKKARLGDLPAFRVKLLFGLEALAEERFRDAADELEEYHRSARPDVETRLILGRAIYYTADIEGAKRALQLALDLDPRHPGTLEALGRILTSGRKFEESIEALEKLVAVLPDSPAAWTALGLAHARSIYFLYGTDPDRVSYHYLQGDGAFQKALALDADHVPALCGRGALRVNHRDYAEAEEDLDRAVRIDPEHIASRMNRGKAREERGAMKQALEDYTAALALASTHPFILRERGLLLAKMDRYRDAVRDLEASLKINPDREDAWVNLGICLTKLNKADGAIDAFTKAIAIRPSAQAYHGRGDARIHKLDFRGAMEEYTKAIEIDDGALPSYANRGRLGVHVAGTLPKGPDRTRLLRESIADMERYLRDAPADDSQRSSVRAELASGRRLLGED